MKIPNAERAIVDVEKLRDYCLNETHPRGKHKARVFAAKLGLTIEHVNQLREKLFFIVINQDAVLDEGDEYGQRYIIDFSMNHENKEAVVRSSWIIRSNEDYPRLTSCYVL